MSDHIPDPGQHRAVHRAEPDTTSAPAEPQAGRRCSPSWARLIAKVYDALFVGLLERLGDLLCDDDRLVEGDRSALEALREVFPFGQLHGQEPRSWKQGSPSTWCAATVSERQGPDARDG
jgi:hypothetical protein